MKAIDKTWKAILDPGYSVLGLPHGVGRNDALYLDVVTGWQGPRRSWPAFGSRSHPATERRDRHEP